ncbi:hypothetical protein K1719_000084 [Acacia pycnantha]|nr:hypothetical protein K1719_000084 [Acacia pycnantha]
MKREGAVSSWISSGDAKLSYKDKLLSPGCGGFLVKHSEEDYIVQGWKDYFNNMNEKDAQNEEAESEEDDDQMTRCTDGKPGALKFTVDEYAAWCLPWMNSLIIMVLGATLPKYIICDRINHKEYAFQEGPWMIQDHYLIVQRWRPNFNPWKADLQCHIAAWIRLLDVPFEFYNVESLRRIGNMIGRMIKVDRSTSIYDKGGFARICVEIDLKQSLLPTYTMFGQERAIVYEGLHQVTSARTTGGTTIVTGNDGEGDSPFGKIRILRRDFHGDINLMCAKKEVNEKLNQVVDQSVSANQMESECLKVGQETQSGNNAKNGEVAIEKGTIKTEWVQVGSKRKSTAKSRAKGKENKPPARDRVVRPSQVGHALVNIQTNPFISLWVEEPSSCKSTSGPCKDPCDKGVLGLTAENVTKSIGVREDQVEASSANKEAMVVVNHIQENEVMIQHPLDEIMCDQDKAEEELDIPQHISIVSQ